MWDKLINVLGLAQGRDLIIEGRIIGRGGSLLKCIGYRHYWEKIVFLPNEPCNCGLYAYQPDEPSGYSKLVKKKTR